MDERCKKRMEISDKIEALLLEQYRLDDEDSSPEKITLKQIIGRILSMVENGREIAGYSIFNHGTIGYGPDYSIIIRLTDKEKQKESLEFKNEYLGTFMDYHDDKACAALKRYDNGLVKTRENMERIARNFGTTMEAMKKHWGCLKNETSKDKNVKD